MLKSMFSPMTQGLSVDELIGNLRREVEDSVCQVRALKEENGQISSLYQETAEKLKVRTVCSIEQLQVKTLNLDALAGIRTPHNQDTSPLDSGLLSDLAGG